MMNGSDGSISNGLALVLYFLPTIIAAIRGLKNATSIFLANAFLGWTVVGWVVALCWATSGTAEIRTRGRG